MEHKTRLDLEKAESQLALKNRALDATAEGITISDPFLPDNPIIFANEGFTRLTGYSASEVVGRNCRFLQGPETCQETLEALRTAIREEREVTIEILNYRKDGTTFWNRLSITPVLDGTGKTTHFIGIQSDVTARKMAEDGLRRANQELEVVNERIRSDLQAAAKIQQSYLPSILPAIPGLNVAWDFRPCDELAGDTLNCFQFDSGEIGFYVLDVSGHGVPAALLSVTLSRWMSPLLARGNLVVESEEKPGEELVLPPVEVGSKLNRQFAMDLETAQYFTILYGILDPETLRLRYFSAAHPPALLQRHRQEIEVLRIESFPVGIVDDPGYSESVFDLAQGDRLIVYTDGVPDALERSDEDNGTERLIDLLNASGKLPLDEAVSTVMDEVERRSKASEFPDDNSMLALEIR